MVIHEGIVWDPADHANYDRRIGSIVLHYTVLDEEGSRETLKHGGVSSHYLIPKERRADANAWQLVDIKDRAWHAGISHWQNREGLNSTSVGIEIVNYGYGLVQEDGTVLWPYQVETKIRDQLVCRLKQDDRELYQLLLKNQLLAAFLADMLRGLVPPLDRSSYQSKVPEDGIKKYKKVTASLRKELDPFLSIKVTDLYGLEQKGKLRWDEFTVHQHTTLVSLLKGLLEELKIKDGDSVHYEIPPTAIIGHSDIAPGRKQDPGPRFPWKYLADVGIGAWPDAQEIEAIKHEIQTDQTIDMAWLQDGLRCYGYNVRTTRVLDEQTREALIAFQMHFEPDNYSGVPGITTLSILGSLIKKYFPKDYVPYPHYHASYGCSAYTSG